ncbi:MAG: putative Ig domain-containing protein, partial [Planctomycetota bacterium]|nr:putative Ig domain-containing protein [Planctomycetota bacterium]
MRNYTDRLIALALTLVATLTVSCGGGGGAGSPTANEPAAPATLAYAENPAVYPMGSPASNAPTTSGGGIDAYAIDPALPQGFSFDTQTGRITGTPEVMAPEQSYTVTANNALGAVSVELSLKVTDRLPVVSYPTTTFALTGGVAMTPVSPVSTGGAVTAYTINPQLPSGLTLNSVTGEVSGAATQVAASWTYTVTASNEGGWDTATFDLEVVAPALSVSLQPEPTTVSSGSAATFVAGAAGSGALTYQWLCDGATIGGATAPTYSIPAATAADDGCRYQLRVSDVFGSVATSDPAELCVVGGAFAGAQSLSAPRGRHTATLLPSGDVLVAGGQDTLVAGFQQSALTVAASSLEGASTGDLVQARSEHVAVRLADGRVLFTGDHAGGAAPAELYEPTLGTFRPTAGAQVAVRRQHTATLLPDGRVLLAGGDDAGALASAELFDPVTETFAATGSMSTPRSAHTATLLNNGLVLITGGADGGASAELFDPVSETFSATGAMATARQHHFAALLGDGKVLVGGGDDGVAVVRSVEVYDPAIGTFATTSPLLTGRARAAAQRLGNGRVVVAGGVDDAGLALASTEVYDPVMGAWFASGALAAPRARLAPGLLGDGRGDVPGGEGDASMLSSTEVFDPEIPAPATFRSTGAMTGRSQFGLSLLPDGRALVTGGTTIGVAAMASAEIYDPATGAWTATGDLNQIRMDGVQVLLPNGKVLAAGGQETLFVPTATAELYDVATGEWTATSSMSTARSSTEGVVMSDGRVLVCGGLESVAVTAASEVFDPVTETWSNTGALSVPRRSHQVIALDNGKVLIIGG